MNDGDRTDDMPLWAWPLWACMRPLAALAPQTLAQPILPGWSVGNAITINERNSSAPHTEREIVAQESYGRQLGHALDALKILIDERPPGAPPARELGELLKLHARIERIKAESREERLERLESDLAKLKEDCPDDYVRLAARLARDADDPAAAKRR